MASDHIPSSSSQGAIVGPPQTLSPVFHLQTPAASESEPALNERPPLINNLSTLSASARTSYTRVDISSTMDTAPRGDPDSQDHGTTQPIDNLAGSEELPGVESAMPEMPQVSLTFLLVSGRRRTMSFDQEMTIGRVKELVWNAWPNEWQDERPPAPSYLRILYLGKILQDDDTLTKVGFASYTPSMSPSANAQEPPSSPPTSTIVHLSIRAYAPPTQDATKKSRRSRQSQTGVSGERAGEGDEEGAGGCCRGCVIC
ncbi:ubiquitin-related domain-containing protein [Cristinia sonorae]|uniref:Ubiquitin-related domain-containing protein n=1 Tax=Cristinia sonorae TaxID=1940300 RepID=A0A8K0UFB9_9AGAR|nr:ubiquitin-related domain-containing protein [Cristinia sonorae]